jgi:hypothetical protein
VVRANYAWRGPFASPIAVREILLRPSYGTVGDVQLPDVGPLVMHGGTVISVTRSKNPVARISSAILVASAALTFGVNVNDTVTGPNAPL